MKHVAAIAALLVAVATPTATAETWETAESFLDSTQDWLATHTAEGESSEYLRKRFFEAGLAEPDVDKIVQAWARETAGCVVAWMREQLAESGDGDEASRIRFLQSLVDDKPAFKAQFNRCSYQTRVRTDSGLLGLGRPLR